MPGRSSARPAAARDPDRMARSQDDKVNNTLSSCQSTGIFCICETLLRDHQRRDHAIHAMLALGVCENMAVERPCAWLGAIHDHIPALARCHVQRIAQVWLR